MSSVYERELKRLLSGDPEVVFRLSRKAPGYGILLEKPFLVVRAAGSLGIDILAVRGGIVLPIEVKSTSTGVVRISRSAKVQEQYRQYLELAARARIVPIYALRLKGARGDPWRILRPSEARIPRDMELFSEIPEIPTSRRGKPILRWDQGLELSAFLSSILNLVD